MASVRTLRDDQGEPWFVAADVCAVLVLSGDPGQHTRRLDDDEKGLISIQTLGGALANRHRQRVWPLQPSR